MRVEQLILEVTRMCNMSCKHCLRGCSQNVYMTKEMVDTIFKDVDSIGSIVFTGGEPFLNLDIIAYTLEVIKRNNIYVGEFFIVTNGKLYEQKQIEVCNAWMEYIISNNFNLTSSVPRNQMKFISQEDLFNYSGIAVSLDEYHEEIPMENYIKYRMLSYYNTTKEHYNENFKLLNEGNASINHIGTENKPILEVSIYANAIQTENSVCLEDIEVEGYLYISANGNIVGDCDLSYEHIDQLSIGNINENSLLKIVTDKYIEEEELSA